MAARVSAVLAKLRALFRRSSTSTEFDREVASHLAEAVDELTRSGLTDEDAYREARRRFGGVTQTVEAYRDGLGWPRLDDWLRDLRLSLRALRRTPGFTLVNLTILGVASGAVLTAATLLDRILLQPLPFADADRLVDIGHSAEGWQLRDAGISSGLYHYYREHARTIDGIGTYGDSASFNVRLAGGEVERARLTYVSASLFHLLGVHPAEGRLFTEDDGRPGFQNMRWPVPVLLSHGFWRDRFGADASIVGRTITINENQRLVVGVMPNGFSFPDRQTQIWMLFEPRRSFSRIGDAGSFDMRALARLAPEASIDSLNAELSTLAAGLPSVFPETSDQVLQEIKLVPRARALKTLIVGDVASALWPLAGAMVILLAIACANAATLFAVRGNHRQRQTMVCVALGAGRWTVIRAGIVEALLVVVAAVSVGLGAAHLAVSAAGVLTPSELPRVDELRLGAGTIAIALTLVVTTTALLAASMLRRSSAAGGTAMSNDGPRTTTARAATSRFLLAAQVALALVLMVLSGLMVRTFMNLSSRPLGFTSERTLTVEVGLPYRLANQHERLYTDVLSRVRQLPTVTDVGGASFLPLTPGQYAFSLDVSATPIPFKFFMPGFFQAIGTPIVDGDGFADRAPRPDREPVLISAPLARRLFGGESPLGKPLHQLEEDGSPVTIGARNARETAPPLVVAGVVADVREQSLRTEPTEMIYVPIVEGRTQPMRTPTSLTLVIRTTGDPWSVTAAARAAVRDAHPALSVGRISTLSDIVASARARETFVGGLLLGAAALAFALGLVGIHGSVAQLVRHRTREIGIRVALGATRREVIALVSTGVAGAVLAGLLSGTVGAIAAAPLLSSLLFAVTPHDPVAFAMAIAALAMAAIAAAGMAATAALRIPIAVAVRNE